MSEYNCLSNYNRGNSVIKSNRTKYDELEKARVEVVLQENFAPMGWTCGGGGMTCIQSPVGEYATLRECRRQCGWAVGAP